MSCSGDLLAELCDWLKNSSRALLPFTAVKLFFSDQSETIFTWRARVFTRLAPDANSEAARNPLVF